MDNEIKNLFEVLIIKNLKTLKKEGDDENRDRILDENNRIILQYQTIINIKCREAETELKVKESEKNLELREKAIDIRKVEIEIRKEQLEIDERLEKAKTVSMILSGVGGILSFGLGVSKLTHQNTWINKGIEFEKTGTWSTKTISNVFNNSIKV